MNEHIAKRIIELIQLQHEFDDKLNELGISISDNGEIGQIFLSLEDKTLDLLLEYMSITDNQIYDNISDLFQSEKNTIDIYHSLKSL